MGGDKRTLSQLIPNSELAWVQGDHATAPMQPEFSTQIVSFISKHVQAGISAEDESAAGYSVENEGIQEDRRIANDGKAYSYPEFTDYYRHDAWRMWSSAQV